MLCSNSRREGGEALLARLGLLGCFDEQIFDAEKPHATTKRMEGWSARWGIPSDAMLFVGDQGYGDLYAGLRAGARTLRVSPYPADDEGLWDACIPHAGGAEGAAGRLVLKPGSPARREDILAYRPDGGEPPPGLLFSRGFSG